MGEVQWVVKHQKDITVPEIYKILQLRNVVFISELQCPVAEIDDDDIRGETHHLMGFDGPRLVAYLRIQPEGDAMHVRRVVVAKDHRGQGLARQMMLESIKWTTKQNTFTKIILSARIHLRDFYESLGFHAVSEPYLVEQVGVVHMDMVKKLAQ